MIRRGLIAALAILALLTLSFGHQPIDPVKQAQATAYMLAGGSFSDLCGDSDAPGARHMPSCEACTISAGCAIPDPADIALYLGIQRTAAWHITPALGPIQNVTGAALARAPPFV